MIFWQQKLPAPVFSQKPLAGLFIICKIFFGKHTWKNENLDQTDICAMD